MKAQAKTALSFKLTVENRKALIYSILRKNFGEDKQRWIEVLRNAIPIFEKDGAKSQAVAAREVLKELEQA